MSKTRNRFSSEVRARANADGCGHHEGEHASRSGGCFLDSWEDRLPRRRRSMSGNTVKRFERDSGVRAGVPSEVAERLKALERENRDLRQVNEILRKASAYFGEAELDRRFKP